MPTFGVTFSLHRARELELDPKAVLQSAITDLGFRRFRLMSYWNIHEKIQGSYDFTELDWQMDVVAQHGGKVSLCLGKRQPRWPECHMPKWAQQLPKEEWYAALYAYIEQVVSRYKDHPALESYQLENEALLKSFGHCPDQDYNRNRLQKELEIVKQTDPNHPVIMTLSNNWGYPFRKPRPDIYGMSMYRVTLNPEGQYHHTRDYPWVYRLRASLIHFYSRKPVFIHELQAEPWVSHAIAKTTIEEQFKSMSPGQLRANIAFAKNTRIETIDLWGLEWWYWLKQTNGKHEIWESVSKAIRPQSQ